MKRNRYAWLVLLLSLFAPGCLAPPFLFPKSGASGVVLDQDSKPLTNAVVKASWLPVRLIPFIADSETRDIRIKADGSWQFYKRKIVKLHIRAYAPPGYEPWVAPNGLDLYEHQCITNVVFTFTEAASAEKKEKQTEPPAGGDGKPAPQP